MNELIPVSGFLFDKPNKCLDECKATVVYYLDGSKKESIVYHDQAVTKINAEGLDVLSVNYLFQVLTLEWILMIHQLAKGSN